VFVVGGCHVNVAEPVATACTATLNAGNDAVATPSLTLMTTFDAVPTSAGPGVPCSRPVAESNVAHAGLLAMLNVNALPSGSDAVGWNE
jgi:hypothetical protein